ALLKPYVQDDQARLPRAHRFERFLAVLGGASLVPLVAEDAGDEHADIRLVIDYENVTRHQTAVIKSEFYPLCAVFGASLAPDASKATDSGGGNETHTRAPPSGRSE